MGEGQDGTLDRKPDEGRVRSTTDIRQLTHGMVEVMQVPRIGSGEVASVVEDRRPGVGNFDPEFDAPPEERPNARVIGERALRQMPRDIEVLGTAVGGIRQAISGSTAKLSNG
jgi:hypothetical protein